MNSHFLAKALCSLAKLSCKQNKEQKEKRWGIKRLLRDLIMFTERDVHSTRLDSVFNDPRSHLKRKTKQHITNPVIHLIAFWWREKLQIMQWHTEKNKCSQFQHEQKKKQGKEIKPWERCQNRSRTDTWRGERWHWKTSFTYRFIVCELQTRFILHCSFAEVNSWERGRERGRETDW